MVFYNENDPQAAQWLRELIRAKQIPEGDVDERSIIDLRPHELVKYTHQHFFAGIGGWALALQFAGWPHDKPVRTGSCPCQPFSQCGRMLGTKDERHLWPMFRDLITFGDFTITFGEQVASPLGREWLAGVRLDLEGLGYEVGASDLCAASVGAPHSRQRLYWVAHPNQWRRRKRDCGNGARQAKIQSCLPGEEINGVGVSNGAGWKSREQAITSVGYRDTIESTGGIIGLGNPNVPGSEGWDERGDGANQRTPWAASVALHCTDGKSRRIEPGSFPLAHGVSGRVGLLRGYGNAIVPQLAAEFIKAACEAF